MEESLSCLIARTQSELEPLRSIDYCRTNRVNGFEGCRDYGKHGCTFDGYYLATYSPEGLCLKCELRQFPDHFHGCLFCGRGMKYGEYCSRCTWAFDKWASRLFSPHITTSSQSHALQKGLFRLHHGNPSKPKRIAVRTKELSDRGEYKWPGFYVGPGKWVTPDPEQLSQYVTLADLTPKNRALVLARELTKCGIVIERDPQFIEGV